jgi:hypothetical protein
MALAEASPHAIVPLVPPSGSFEVSSFVGNPPVGYGDDVAGKGPSAIEEEPVPAAECRMIRPPDYPRGAGQVKPTCSGRAREGGVCVL